MELQELKSAWKSVEPHIPQQGNHNNMPTSTLDTKSRLLRSICISMAFTILGLIVMVSSLFWALAHLDTWWIVSVCVLMLIGVLAELHLINLIKRINFWSHTHSEILDTVIRIKKYYRNMEVWISIGAAILFGYLSFTPPFFNSWNMAVAWGAIIIGFAIEYFAFYRKNTKRINQLENWFK